MLPTHTHRAIAANKYFELPTLASDQPFRPIQKLCTRCSLPTRTDQSLSVNVSNSLPSAATGQFDRSSNSALDAGRVTDKLYIAPAPNVRQALNPAS
jgi:hypothetical protein